MRTITLVCALAAALVAAMASTPSQPAWAQSRTIKVTAVGPDGKPVEIETQQIVEIGRAEEAKFDEGGEFTPTDEGYVITVIARDKAGNVGETSTFVPEGQTAPQPIVVTLKPPVDFDNGMRKAQTAKDNDDAVGFKAGIDEAKEDTTRNEAAAQELQRAINDWAISNGLPILTLTAVKKRIARAENLPKGETEPIKVDNLQAYQAKLEALQSLRDTVGKQQRAISAMKPPLMGSYLPSSTCPEGQSGGLLAGLLNNVTGTNSFTGICGETPEKDRKDRKNPDRGEHEHD